MLLSPEHQEQGRHLGEDDLSPMNSSVATRTQRDHQVQGRVPRMTVMHCDRPFIPARGPADPAAIFIALENSLTHPTEVFFVLALQCVAARTEAERENLLAPAWATYRELLPLGHHFPL